MKDTSHDDHGRVLVVEDNDSLRALITLALTRAGHRSATCATGGEAIDSIAAAPPALMLLDHKLPDMGGDRLLDLLEQRGLQVPFVVMTGNGDERLAVAMMKRGAADYLQKDGDFLDLLLITVARVLRAQETERALRASEEGLRETRERLSSILDHISNVVWSFSWPELDRVLYVSPSCLELYGHPPEAFLSDPGLWLASAHPEDRPALAASQKRLTECDRLVQEYRIVRPDGNLRWVVNRCRLVRDGQGRATRLDGVITDITDRRRAEEAKAANEKVFSEINSCLVGLGLDYHTNVNALTALCGRLLGATCAIYSEMRGSRLTPVGTWNIPAGFDPLTHPEGRFCHDVIREGERAGLIVRRFVAGDAGLPMPEPSLSGCETCVGHAVSSGGRTVGSLCLFYRHGAVPPDESAGIVSIITAALGAEEQRHRDQETIRDKEARQRHILDSLPAMICEFSPDTTLTYVNEPYCRHCGVGAEALLGTSWLSLLPEPERANARRACLSLAPGQAPARFQYRVTLAGEEHWYRWELFSLHGLQCDPLGFMALGTDITDRKRREAMERSLEVERNQLFSVFNSIDEAIYIADPHSYELLYVNEKLAGLLPPGNPLGKKCHEVLQGRAAPCPFCTNRIILARKPEPYRWEHYNPYLDRHYAIVDRVIRWHDGREVRFEMATDIEHIKESEAEREKIRAQLIQAQKMETVGRLAGGVAHDFNNMLGVIIGYGEMILESLPEESPMRADLGEILAAGERSANLTRQLLAFSRKQTLKPEEVDLNGLLGNLEKMLRRLIGEDIELVLRPAEATCWISADPGQIEQVIMNLAVNARDAMPGGGRLTIATEVALAGTDLPGDDSSLPAGEYIALSVEDTGFGMDFDTRQHIFEPFFTTKEQGKGTGLGLATVHGIVEQSGGTITVSSDPGRGATFTMYLPRVSANPVRRRLEARRQVEGRGETVLVVEDEEAVRGLATNILKAGGYQVLTAAHPGEAMDLLRERGRSITLLLSDVIMPQMSGPQLVEQACAALPHLRVVYMSGYTDNAIVLDSTLPPGIHFIEKPFTGRALLGKVRQALDGPPPGATPALVSESEDSSTRRDGE